MVLLEKFCDFLEGFFGDTEKLAEPFYKMDTPISSYAIPADIADEIAGGKCRVEGDQIKSAKTQ